jgi:hypothetical protein
MSNLVRIQQMNAGMAGSKVVSRATYGTCSGVESTLTVHLDGRVRVIQRTTDIPPKPSPVGEGTVLRLAQGGVLGWRALCPMAVSSRSSSGGGSSLGVVGSELG